MDGQFGKHVYVYKYKYFLSDSYNPVALDLCSLKAFVCIINPLSVMEILMAASMQTACSS